MTEIHCTEDLSEELPRLHNKVERRTHVYVCVKSQALIMHRQGACECIAYVGMYIVTTHSMMLPAGKQMATGNNRMV